MARAVSTPRRARLLAMTAFLCLGCASGTGATGEPRASLNVLTGEELRETGAGNLWDALRQRRPQWLRSRATTSLISPLAEEPVVYVQGIHHGPLTSLQQMSLDQVRRVEFIDGRDATTRFGTGHGGGVIMVDLDRS